MNRHSRRTSFVLVSKLIPARVRLPSYGSRVRALQHRKARALRHQMALRNSRGEHSVRNWSSKTADLATVLTERNGSFLEVPQKFLRCLLIHGQVLKLIDPMRMYRILASYFRKNLRTAATVRLVVVDERNSGFPSSAYNMR